jgi:anti-sigma factor RsiW
MNCKSAGKLMIAWLDGSLKVEQRHSMEQHLTACQVCSARSRELRELWALLDEVPVLSPAPAFDSTVFARAAREAQPYGLLRWLAAPSPRLTLGAAALVVLSLWLSSLPRVERAAPTPVRGTEAEFGMIEELPMFEDYDVLLHFDVLSELPGQELEKPPSGL